MAMIRCPECSTEVSSLAAACPKCAAPIANATAARAVGQGVTTTEMTSKALKKKRLASVGFIVVGVVVMMSAGSDSAGDGMRAVGGIMLLAGLVLYIVVSAQKWWHHS